MKKYFALALTLLLAFSAVSAGAASFTDLTEKDNYYVAVTHLSNLGIINGYEDGSYRADEVMSRGEFAVVMAKLSGSMDSQMTLPNLYFKDLPEEHFAKNSIIYCIQLGLMEGYGDGTFHPDQPITYAEAVKITVSALGYYPLAQVKGGYPAGFIAQANELGILNGIGKSISDNITRGEIAHLSYQAVKVQLLEQVSVGDGSKLETRGNTLLSKYLKMDFIEGVVSSNGYTKIEFVPDVGPQRLVIGGITLHKANAYSRDCLGMYAEAIYRQESMELVSIVPSQRKNNQLSIDGNDITKASESGISYEFGDRETDVRVSDVRKVVYNGSFRFDYTLDALVNLQDGDVRLLDNNGDGSYEILFVNEYENYIVQEKAPSSRVIRDKKQGDKALDLEEYETVLFHDQAGNLLDYETIGHIEVLSVLASPDYVECIVVNDVRSGEISQIISQNEDEVYYLINDVSYRLSDAFVKNKDNVFQVGDTATLYLDARGNVAYAEKTMTSGYKVAVLMGMLRASEGFDTALKFKLFTRENEIAVLSADTYLTVNGTRYASETQADAVQEELTYRNADGEADRGVSQFIIYKTSADGLIKEIETAQGTDAVDAKLYRTAPTSQLHYVSASASFDGLANIDAGTWLLKIPSGDLTDKEADDFQVFASTDFVNELYQIEFFNTSKTKQIVDIVSLTDRVPSVFAFDDALAIMGKMVKGIDASGDVKDKIRYFSEGEWKEAFISDTFSLKEGEAPGPGDTLRVSLDNDGQINGIERFYDYANDKWVYPSSYNGMSVSNYYGATARISVGYAAYIRDGYLRLDYEEKKIADDGEAALLESYKMNNGYTVYVVNSATGEIKVRAGDIGDIELLDRVVIRMRAGAGREIFVYKSY